MAKRSTRTVHDYTLPDIIIAFQKYKKILDITTLSDEELKAFECLDHFWNEQNVFYYEKTLDIDKFYDIKDHHTILNSKHSPESTVDIDLKWWDYIEKAMTHRLGLTAKRYMPLMQLLSSG